MQLVCLICWTIQTPCGMLMSSVLKLNIPLTLYDLCVQQSRGSLVMGLARLAENMMGVLICQQVVLLNDGRAGSPVECSSGWVGCGLTVWATPYPPLPLLECSFTEWAWPSWKKRRFFSTTVWARRRPGIGWNTLPVHAPTWLPPPSSPPRYVRR